jgi:hypothetical protein
LASREFNPNAYIVGALQGHVRAAEVTALGANLRHAAQTAHAQFLAPGTHLSAITMGGKTVILRNGYPDATASGHLQCSIRFGRIHGR